MCYPYLPILPKAENVNLYYQTLGVSCFRDGQLGVQVQVALHSTPIPTTTTNSDACTELNLRRKGIILTKV